MPEMKAGPELDARLCRLLEPKPTAQSQFWLQFVFDWRPIRVSTDYGPMGKAIKALEKLGYGITLMTPTPHPDGGHDQVCFATLWPWFDPCIERDPYEPAPQATDTAIVERGDDLPHALALAASVALEKRAEAAP